MEGNAQCRRKTPAGWNNNNYYWSATPSAAGHTNVNLGNVDDNNDKDPEPRPPMTIDLTALTLADVLEPNPRRAHTLHALVLAQLQNGDAAAAGQSLQELMVLRPADTALQALQAAVALALHKPAEAVRVLAQVLQQRPGDAAAWFNLGQALLMLQDWTRAVQAFDRLLALQPANAEGFYGRGLARRALGEHGQAGKDVSQTLRLQPGHSGALQEQANALLVAGAFEEALAAFGRVQSRLPDAPFVAGMRLFLARQLCHWAPLGLLPLADAGLEAAAQASAELAALRLRALRGEPALEPFASLILYDDPALHQEVASRWLHKLHPPAPGQRAGVQPLQDGRLRVAYVSSDFYKHATSYLLAGVLEQHCRERVDVVLLSYGLPKNDGMRARLEKSGGRWMDVHQKTDAEVAALCRELGVHVAVDLKGLTRDSRPGIFAHRAAPLQVNWLGFPGTLGAPYYDYMLADRVVVPEAQRAHYAEAIAYLPHCYQPNDDRRAMDATPPIRAAHGLPESGLVLCCFNNSFKITPEVWALWMGLLQATPGSVLWLLQAHARAAHNLRQQAAAHGLDPARLVFAPHMDLPLHLARLQLADLSLDTLPYNAHTTASDALWAGVPHITCMGQSFASRVGASLLQAVGLPELITSSMPAYAALALALLQDPGRLRGLRARLALHRRSAPLFDTAGFARDLEQAFVQMHRRQMDGLPPEDFDLACAP